MLESLHKHMKWIMWIIVGLVTVAFVFTFGNYPTGGEGGTIAAVNGDIISVNEFNRAYQNMHETYRDMLKDQFNEAFAKTLRGQVLGQLINQRLLIQEAERRGLRVSDEELRQSIMNIPLFNRQGGFDQKVYERYLSRINLTAAAFEEMQRWFLLSRKLERLIEESVDVTERELMVLYRERNPKSRSGDFEKNKASFRQTILAEKRGAALDAYLSGLRVGAKIKINSEAAALE